MGAFIRLGVLGVVVLSLAGPASAQDLARDASADDAMSEGDASLQLRLEEAHHLRGIGMGLTLGGLLTAGGGTASLFAGRLDGAIAGGTFAGLGGVLGLVGIPMWIVGAIRSDVLGAPREHRASVAWSYELAGIVTTLSGIGIALVGVALMFVGPSLVRGGERTHEVVIGTGGVLIPIGTFIALFIGVPMWAEAARISW